MNLRQQKEIQKSFEVKLDSVISGQKELVEETKSCLEAFKSSSENVDRPWLNDRVPKKVQEQLNELHDKHQTEIKRLEREIEMQRTRQEEKENTVQVFKHQNEEKTMFNVYDFALEEKKATGQNETVNIRDLLQNVFVLTI